MKLIVTTESGSIYTLDKEKMMWFRVSDPEHALRTPEGDLLDWPTPVVGQPMTIMGTALCKVPTGFIGGRLIMTTPVTSIEVLP